MSNIAKFAGFVLTYIAAVWVVLSFIPAISTAARVPMTARLWLYTAGGYFWGWYLGTTLVYVVLGGRLLPYGRWDLSRCREPKTWLGDLVALVVASGVGVFAANMALEYALKHP
jgi:hypothetical protein